MSETCQKTEESQETLTTQQVLRDLAHWMRRRLDTSQAARSGHRGYAGSESADGFVVVEVPDWEMRQKLSAVEQALKSVDTPPPCARCDELDEHRAQAEEGMRTAAEISGLM